MKLPIKIVIHKTSRGIYTFSFNKITITDEGEFISYTNTDKVPKKILESLSHGKYYLVTSL